MKSTIKGSFQKKLIQFGKKNIDYCRNNVKRFTMISVSLAFFIVYSSFSFPLFISGSGAADYGLKLDNVPDVEFAKEATIDPEELALLDDDDVRMEGEISESIAQSMNIVASSSDLLESNPDYRSMPAKANESSEDYQFHKEDWQLVLINKQHSIPEDYEVQLGSINTIKGSMQCDERIINDLMDMIKAAKEDNVVLAICSPYRDFSYQEMLFNRKIKRYMNAGMSYLEAYQLAGQAVTVPGASEHQIGLALDIITDTYTSLDEGFGKTAAGMWLAENSYRFGFILRYPQGKEYITGIEYEPWHFRYVGVDAATVITQNGITLEEFWEEYL